MYASYHTVVDEKGNPLRSGCVKDIVEWLRAEIPVFNAATHVRIGQVGTTVPVEEYLKLNPFPKQEYEVWGFLGTGDSFGMTSDDPVEIVHWLRTKKAKGEGGYNVHPVGRGFHSHSVIEHDFISRHAMATAEDIVQKAFAEGKSEGLAQELHDLFFGRVKSTDPEKFCEKCQSPIYKKDETDEHVCRLGWWD